MKHGIFIFCLNDETHQYRFSRLKAIMFIALYIVVIEALLELR